MWVSVLHCAVYVVSAAGIVVAGVVFHPANVWPVHETVGAEIAAP